MSSLHLGKIVSDRKNRVICTPYLLEAMQKIRVLLDEPTLQFTQEDDTRYIAKWQSVYFILEYHTNLNAMSLDGVTLWNVSLQRNPSVFLVIELPNSSRVIVSTNVLGQDYSTLYTELGDALNE